MMLSRLFQVGNGHAYADGALWLTIYIGSMLANLQPVKGLLRAA